MAKNRTRGGLREPAKPAPVPAAGPGAGKGMNRTDGGPGSSTQPIRRIPGVGYGEQSALSAQQAAAPLPAQGGPSMGGQIPTTPMRPDVFAGTERPNEPITEGVPIGMGSMPIEEVPSVNVLLAALYQVNPHPAIAELLNSGN